jgi:hypothetical protein
MDNFEYMTEHQKEIIKKYNGDFIFIIKQKMLSWDIIEPIDNY